MISEKIVRCNHCYATFEEDDIQTFSEDGEECCPCCGEVGGLMDLQEEQND